MRELRLSASQRITGALWGAIVSGAAVTAMYALSGHKVNLTNVAIVALAVLGGWLLVSALVSARPRSPRPDAEDSSVAEAAAGE